MLKKQIYYDDNFENILFQSFDGKDHANYRKFIIFKPSISITHINEEKFRL